MSDAFMEFGLLLASVWGAQQGPSLVHRVAATDSLGADLLYGADRTGGRHVLAPVADDYSFTAIRGAAVELTEWRHPQTAQRYLDLVCTVDGLSTVFYRLADSVVERIEQRREQCHAALFGALTDWQRLLKPSASLSEEVLRGLFGELVVLRLLAQRNAIFALDAWLGPTGHVHDFATANGDVEVKATNRDGRDVEISSLNQLDEVAGVPLSLIRVRVEDSPGGQSIGDLVDDLVRLGCLRSAVVEKLDSMGFQVGITADDSRFVVTGPLLAWSVGTDFPGLRSADLPENRRDAVKRIKYTLDLLNAPGEMAESELDTYIDRMMTK
ncbi:hypothetical protein ASH01_17070 [Terrabacter sp. Soil811]|uniref:PD-(D/E)XK motif protein n=1 Tax=Terrabacter sp. Soil811 TaxID=1736419 RepID=UPI0006F48CFD|nr:PD-(D/E)XK motif protein [Terrabacter sp. Soil811]KRF42534.1 hypothetical protein ASH01_17070 [Terrabacter sp. Soil811]